MNTNPRAEAKQTLKNSRMVANAESDNYLKNHKSDLNNRESFHENRNDLAKNGIPMPNIKHANGSQNSKYNGRSRNIKLTRHVDAHLIENLIKNNNSQLHATKRSNNSSVGALSKITKRQLRFGTRKKLNFSETNLESTYDPKNPDDKLKYKNNKKNRFESQLLDESSLSVVYTVPQKIGSKEKRNLKNRELSPRFQFTSRNQIHSQDTSYVNTGQQSLNINKASSRRNYGIGRSNGYSDSFETEEPFGIIPKEKDNENARSDVKNDDTPFQKLTTITKPISQHVIESNWSTLPVNCIQCVASLLQEIQFPIIISFNDKHKRTQTSKFLKLISRSLVRKISRGMLFPLSTHKNHLVDFDFKRISNYNRSLEAQLTPTLHASTLLHSVLGDELEYLRIEKQKLLELETNSKSENTLTNDNARKLHSVFRNDYGNHIYNTTESVGLELFSLETSNPNVQHENFSNLLKQIKYHVMSLQDNAKQVRGVSEAVTRTKATLQDNLFEILNNVEYEEIAMSVE